MVLISSRRSTSSAFWRLLKEVKGRDIFSVPFGEKKNCLTTFLSLRLCCQGWSLHCFYWFFLRGILTNQVPAFSIPLIAKESLCFWKGAFNRTIPLRHREMFLNWSYACALTNAKEREISREKVIFIPIGWESGPTFPSQSQKVVTCMFWQRSCSACEGPRAPSEAF